jgi:hypothetical protein
MQHWFEYFDPLEGEPPKHRASEFWEVLFQARNLLKDRTREEVLSGALILNEIRANAAFQEPIFDLIENWAPRPYKLSDGSISEAMPAPDEVDGYVFNMGRINLAEWPQLPSAHWHELFAILALSYVEKMHHEEQRQESASMPAWRPRLDDAGLNEEAYEYLVLAKHALSIADRLIHTKKEISGRSRKAVQAHHNAKTGALKARVIQLYAAKYRNRSIRDAASRIMRELIELGELVINESGLGVFFKGQLVLQTDDPQNRLERWISQFKATDKG